MFLGPSLPLAEARTFLDADYRPPCRRGDLAALAPGTIVGIIDGVFHESQAISPREILTAIGSGVVVFGSSSMGALRAVEVPAVRGVGRVFEMYRDGVIVSDDEVAVTFDIATLAPVTVPLVNTRFAVQTLVQCGTISEEVGASILDAASRLHYTQRTYPRILREARLHDRPDSADLVALLSSIDLKGNDACLLLEQLASFDPAQLARQHAATTETSNAHIVHADYGAARKHGHVTVPPRTRAVGDILIWETGDRFQFVELVEYLVITDRVRHPAEAALFHLVTHHALSDTTIGVHPLREVGKEFRRRCRGWGWRTEEETRVTMTDLALGTRDVLETLRSEDLRASAIDALLRSSNAAFLRALRTELFIDDLNLKREAMVFGGLRSLAAHGTRTSAEAREWARGLLCRLHGIGRWEVLREKLSDRGVPRRRVRAFVGLLASARDAHRRCRRVTRDAKARVRSRWYDSFGLASTPKPPGELKVCLRETDALQHLDRIRKSVGICRVGFVEGLTSIRGMYVTQAARPGGLWSSSYGSGKSQSRASAVVGAVMEEAEKWANEQFRGDPISASFDELRQEGRSAVDPRSLALPYDSRYRPSLRFSWQECADLITGRSTLVPLALLVPSSTARTNNVLHSQRAGRVVFSTNGLASGFSLADALVHATCECIERHVTKLAELRIDNPGLSRATDWPREVDVDGVASIAPLLARLREAGFDARVYDLTSGIRVPTLLARISTETNVAPGWGTHPNPVVACERALLEACQTIANSTAGGREDLSVQARSLGRHERPRPRRQKADAFWFTRRQPPVPLSTLPGLSAADVLADFEWTRSRLMDAGVEHLLAVDLSQPETLPARVVRVVIPGLETTNPFCCGPAARQVLADEVLLA